MYSIQHGNGSGLILLQPQGQHGLVTGESYQRSVLLQLKCMFRCHVVDSFQALIEYQDALSAQAAKVVRVMMTFAISSV